MREIAIIRAVSESRHRKSKTAHREGDAATTASADKRKILDRHEETAAKAASTQASDADLQRINQAALLEQSTDGQFNQGCQRL